MKPSLKQVWPRCRIESVKIHIVNLKGDLARVGMSLRTVETAMNPAEIKQYIREAFEGIQAVDASGGTFFFDGPDRKFPFATLVTSDEYDQVSDLDRPDVFRLNIGAGKETFQSIFGEGDRHDFTALDRIMPHPVYGKMYWICVLNPGEETFEKIKPMLTEAHDLAARRSEKLHRRDK